MTKQEKPVRKPQPSLQDVQVERLDQLGEHPYYSPLVDIYESGDELILSADMPGVSNEGVEVTFENGVLTVNGRSTVAGVSGVNRLYQEYVPGDYHRCFKLSDLVDSTGMTARMRDGVLTVRMPRTERARTRRIEVK